MSKASPSCQSSLSLALLSLFASCGPSSGQATTPPPACGDGIASRDLAGACRADPPTMGALEAVRE